MPVRPPSPPRASRRALRLGGAVLGLIVCALVAAALIPSSHAAGAPRAHQTVARASAGAGRTRVLQTRVVGSSVSARRYAAVATGIENGVNSHGTYVDDLTPINWHRVLGPITRYRHYAEGWARRLGSATSTLTVALASGDRDAAQRDWRVAFADYLHLGAVYGLLPGTLNDRLAEVPPSDGDDHFPGLHRIEKGLWTGAPPRSLVPVARAVARADMQLRRILPGLWIGAFDYTLRGHEILEDAQRDLLSGTDVPWSGDGVGATAASLVAEREVIDTLTPLLTGRNNTLGVARYWLARMASALRAVRRADGSYPSLRELSVDQRGLLDGTLAGTCAALAAVPETLELHPIPDIPMIPRRR